MRLEGATGFNLEWGCNVDVTKEWLFRTRLDLFDGKTAIRQISQTTMVDVRRDGQARSDVC